jgi:hypothetical protein
MKNDWLILPLCIAAAFLGILLFPFVHVGLQHLCVLHARRYCRRRGLTPIRSRSGTAFDASGMKTEYTVVELDCRDTNGNTKRVRLLVWVFGVRKILEDEEPQPPPPVAAGLLPASIPYNPSLSSIGFFLGLGILFLVASQLLPRAFPILILFSLLFTLCAVLLWLRRTLWTRQLHLSETAITVPTGFLRLRPVTVRYADIEFVWIAVLGVTRVLSAKTPDRTLEIQDIFLPDRDTFGLLHHHLNSFVRPPEWDNAV